jgi:hypothetical protein
MSSAAISPNPSPNKGLDYTWLRALAIQVCQQLSSSSWTDYNEHDPGVTTVEQLCYAITELSYRAEMPVATILGDVKTGIIHPNRHGLYTARQILPCNPVTCNDYRKLLADRVRGVANVWLTPLAPPAGSRAVNGLYEIHVYAPGPHHRHKHHCGPDPAWREREILLRRVRRVYNRHRELCEDLHGVRILKPLPLRVYADVSVDGTRAVEKILAEILFAIGKLAAPELQRKPLNAMLDEGKSPDQIFNGPLLRDGFIDDSELQPPLTSLAVNDVIRAIGLTTDVLSVRHLTAQCGHEGERPQPTRYGPNQTIPIPRGRVLELHTTLRAEGTAFTIRIYRHGAECHPDPDIVELELKLLWAGYRRVYPLALQYEEYFGIPKGTGQDLEPYYSIQNQFPTVYGISAYGLPADPTPERKGQAKQFKGYLLAFEQLMADYFAQLANAGNLFSDRPDPWRTYYSQSLAKSVPDVEPILSANYMAGLKEIVASEDTMVERRNHFAAYLLSLYAEELDAISTDAQCTPNRRSAEKLLRARLEFLRALVRSTRRRGRGFDCRALPSPWNVAGMEIKCRIQMGLDLERRTSLTQALAESGVKLAGGDRHAGTNPPGLQSSHIDEHFQALASFGEPAAPPAHSGLLKGNTITEEFLNDGRDPANLFVGNLPAAGGTGIALRNTTGGWQLLDTFSGAEEALAEAYVFCNRLQKIHRARTQLYIVEHTLLRFGRVHKRPQEDDFAYSFALTAVVGLPSDERSNPNNRSMVEQIVRENTPAHILAQICCLDSCALLTFEHLYQKWRVALRKRRSLSTASWRLRRFLERHTR